MAPQCPPSWPSLSAPLKEGTVKPVIMNYGNLGTNKNCPDYQGVLIFRVSLYGKAPFGTITKCVDYAGIHIINCPD